LAGEDGVADEPQVRDTCARTAYIEKGVLGKAANHAGWPLGVELKRNRCTGQTETNSLPNTRNSKLGGGEETFGVRGPAGFVGGFVAVA
jgi:hypothetical protein